MRDEELGALKKIDQDFKFPNLSHEVVVFGGSFSPWHEGHEVSVDLCRKLFPDALIMIVPDRNPFKSEYQTGYNLYSELISLTKKWDRVFVYPKFLLMTEGNPTVNWLPSLPYQKKWLLLGEDSFSNIESWKDSKKLLDSLYGIIVSPRLKGEEWFEEHRKHIQSLHHKLEIRRLPSHPFEHISSTNIRST